MNTSPLKLSALSFSAAIALALAATIALPVGSAASEPVKGAGAQKLIERDKSQTGKPVVAASGVVPMSCPKCKNVRVTRVTALGKGAFNKTTTYDQHLCPGCKTTTTTTGHGKAKTDRVSHVCNDCGSADAFCCVVKKGAGPTKGMDKK